MLAHVLIRSLFILPLALTGQSSNAQFGPPPASISVSVAEAAPGQSVKVHGTDLTASTTIELRLANASGSFQIAASVATNSSGDFVGAYALPQVAPGDYAVRALSNRGALLASTPLRITSALTLAVSPGPAVAGRSLQVALSGIEKAGKLTLSYLGRNVFGPSPVGSGSANVKFILPADVPTGFPASVELKARVVSGASSQSGSALFTVTAPRLGPFIGTSGLVSSKSSVRSNETFVLSGKISVDGGPPPDDLTFSAWWIGDNGQVLPLGGAPIGFAADGSFQMQTAAPSLGSMSFADATGPGHIRFVGQRDSPYSTGPEHEIVEGPSMTTTLDVDPDIDITVLVRGQAANGTDTGPLDGAFVRLSGGAPLVDSSTQPTTFHAVGLYGINQVTHGISAAQVPNAGCEPTLNQLFTEDDGRAEFLIEQASSMSGLRAVGNLGVMAVGPVCHDIPGNPPHGMVTVCDPDPNITEYTIEVRGRHIGYGRTDSSSGGELPEIWHVTYHKQTRQFTLRNPRTGQQMVQNNSANLTVRLTRSLSGNDLLIGDPTVSGLRARPRSDGSVAIGQSTVNFSALIDFSGTSATLQFPGSLRHTVQFRHFADIDGDINSAQLRIDGNVVGQFSPVPGSGAGGSCPAVGSVNGGLWRLEPPAWFDTAMRYPALSWPGRNKVCGTIEISNAAGRTGSRQICFNWVPAPGYLHKAGSYTVREFGGGNYQLLIEGNNLVGGAQDSAMPNPGYGVGRRENHAERRHAVFQTFDDGQVSSDVSDVSGDHKQFGRTPAASSEPMAEGAIGGSFGDPDWDTLFDQTFKIFEWYWGVPEVFSASLYAELRVVAEKLFHGRWNSQQAIDDLSAHARFQVFLTIGVDIDVLFGLLVDAGAAITGMLGSDMAVEVNNGQVSQSQSGLFFLWGLYFSGWVEVGCPIDFPLDPTCWIPDITENYTIAQGSEQVTGVGGSARRAIDGKNKAGKAFGDPLPVPADERGPLSNEEKQALFRHPAMAYDSAGHGMAIALDDRSRLMATELAGRVPGNTHQLSSGLGIRSTAIVFLSPNRALAVWAESTLTPTQFAAASLLDKAAAQRLHFATWDGIRWSDKLPLWNTPGGDAHPVIAVCKSVLCGRSGAATVAFSHRHGGLLDAADMRTWYVTFNVAGGFGTPRQVDPSSSPRLEVSPAIAYDESTPVIAWVHYAVQDLSQVDTRQLRYRHLSTSTVHGATDLPSEMASPVLASRGQKIALAFTVPDRLTGFAGTRQALHYAETDCSGDVCDWEWKKLRDAYGRVVYGQGPRLMFDSAGEPLIGMRAFAFGAGADGVSVRTGDPLGTANLSGDLLAIRVDFAAGRFAARGVTDDAGSHFQSSLAINPLSGDITSLSTTIPQLQLRKSRGDWSKILGKAAGHSRPVAKLAGDMVALNAINMAPDPTLLSLSTTATQFVSGASVPVILELANLGAALDPNATPLGFITFRFDAPAGSDPAAAVVELPPLGAAEQTTLAFNLSVPAGLDPDQGHTLFAVLQLTEGTWQSDGTNDQQTLRLGDLPVPQGVNSEVHPGMPFVRIGWDAVDDPRVVGYRVYVEVEPDLFLPIGSSDIAGFLDLGAQFGQQRRYVVTSYSARGIESARSQLVTAQAPDAQRVSSIFSDGYELLQ